MSSFLRGLALIVVLVGVTWVGGVLMEASHVDKHTHNLVGVAIAAAVVVGGAIMFKVRSRR